MREERNSRSTISFAWEKGNGGTARVDPRLSICIGEIRPIARHTTDGGKFSEWIDGWYPKIRCQPYNLLPLDRKKRIAADQKPVGA